VSNPKYPPLFTLLISNFVQLYMKLWIVLGVTEGRIFFCNFSMKTRIFCLNFMSNSIIVNGILSFFLIKTVNFILNFLILRTCYYYLLLLFCIVSFNLMVWYTEKFKWEWVAISKFSNIINSWTIREYIAKSHLLTLWFLIIQFVNNWQYFLS